MVNARTLEIGLRRETDGQSLSRYRNFELGSDMASVATLAGLRCEDAKTIRQRPALLQELTWRFAHWDARSTDSTDPVERIVFGFYDDQLFRVVVDYARERTEGLTPVDMRETISAVYGAPLQRMSGARDGAVLPHENLFGSPVARWGNARHAIVLYRTSSSGAFRLVVMDARLDGLAGKAEALARRREDHQAPRLDVARQNKQRDDQHAAAKARIVIIS